MTESRMGSTYKFYGEIVVVLGAEKAGATVYYQVLSPSADGYQLAVDDEVMQTSRDDFLANAEAVFLTPPSRSEIDDALSLMETYASDLSIDAQPTRKERTMKKPKPEPKQQPDGKRVLFSKQVINGVASRYWVRAAAAEGHSNEDIAAAFLRLNITPGMDTLRQNAKIGREAGQILPEWGLASDQIDEFLCVARA